MHIDKPDLFKQTLSNGINLFTGAGFSLLPDCDGKVLPASESLSKEICERFDIDGYNYDLEKISNFFQSCRFLFKKSNWTYLMLH